ncbi:MAG: phosphoglucosamine mutase [Candidatus Falkowbacteria bacterium]|nr:phosphoglucosamine mutase [Candidatus Falkowbacteria bacterium]
MPLIKSISGIRGTIGGVSGENLTPLDIVNFTGVFVLFLNKKYPGTKIKVVIGRDGRVSGEMVKNLTVGTLLARGVNVIDLGLATTPTVEVVVVGQKAQGGIILSASHNPQGWNALKFIDARGEFLSKVDGEEILALAQENKGDFSSEENLGSYVINPFLFQEHLRQILEIPLVDVETIKSKNLKVVVDGINAVGGMAVPELLKLLGIDNIIELNCEPNGQFTHKPEPLAENLAQIREVVKKEKADLGIVVDPDVDRLAFIMENGEMLSEEYTIVAIADYVLENFAVIETARPGKYTKNTVSNLSSSRALKDITEKHGGQYEAAAVGEVNVVTKMKELRSVIGGEGNGGVIFPELHYGRDALVGIALFLSYLVKKNISMSEMYQELPQYFMVKDRIELTPDINLPAILEQIKQTYSTEKSTDIDGVKIDWADSWVHLRGSNTEPIIRVYAEAKTLELAQAKVKEIKDNILAYIK